MIQQCLCHSTMVARPSQGPEVPPVRIARRVIEFYATSCDEDTLGIDGLNALSFFHSCAANGASPVS